MKRIVPEALAKQGAAQGRVGAVALLLLGSFCLPLLGWQPVAYAEQSTKAVSASVKNLDLQQSASLSVSRDFKQITRPASARLRQPGNEEGYSSPPESETQPLQPDDDFHLRQQPHNLPLSQPSDTLAMARQTAPAEKPLPLALQALRAVPELPPPPSPLAPSVNQGQARNAASPLAIQVYRGRSQLVKFAQPIVRLSIADPTIADIVPLSPNQVMVNGKQRGSTSLVVWDEEDHEGIFDLQVLNDTSQVLQAIEALAPNESIRVTITDDSLIVTGRASSSVIMDEIRRLASAYGYRDANFVDLTETPVPQVSLEVRIAEANRSAVQDLTTGLAVNITDNFGITKVDSVAQNPSATVSNARNQAFQFDQQTGFNSRLAAGQLLGGNSVGVGSTIGAFTPNIGDDFNLQFRFEALETSGKITLLAEPTLVCTHGRTASFLVGGEFPFVTGVAQNGQPIINFKEFGIRLRFTPWIAMRTGRVELRVEPEVSSIDTTTSQEVSGATVFGLLTRRTDTTVELNDGESLLISGLLTRDETEVLQKMPYIADIPILGNFFKNRNNNRADRELIVLVTPHIVEAGTYGRILGNSRY